LAGRALLVAKARLEVLATARPKERADRLNICWAVGLVCIRVSILRLGSGCRSK
jgi:hypothetical protein